MRNYSHLLMTPASSPGELHRIAHNDAYFGLIGTVDSHDRSKLLDEKLAMSEQTTFASTNSAPANNVAENNNMGPSINASGQVQDDGFDGMNGHKEVEFGGIVLPTLKTLEKMAAII